MQSYKASFGNSDIAGAAEIFGTPFWLYDLSVMEKRVSELRCFDVIRYAQKACSNICLLSRIRKLGVVVDAVSAGEIERSLAAGYSPQDVRYTADIFDRDSLALVKKHGIPVNAGSPDMINQMAEAGINVPLAIRINPGFGHGHSSKVNTGGELSKHGIWHEDLAAVLELAKEKGYSVECLHFHIGSGADFEHLSKVATAMEKAVAVAGKSVNIISAGGGLPIPYKPENQERININDYYAVWDSARKRMEQSLGHSLVLEIEPGRYLVAESCVLVTEIRAVKKVKKNLFYLVNAGFTDLVRPAFYGAYHHISIVPRNSREPEQADVIVAGPLCESGDVFTQEEGGYVVSRKLPLAQVGDLLIMQDAGAYGAAMSSNYNSKYLSPEVLFENGEFKLIRKRQTAEQMLANELCCMEG